MTAYRISDVARRSGFSTATLRYYEGLGLVPPAARTEAGYRIYDDESLARLAFISRAKQLGCSLDEVGGLLTAWEGKRCEPVQSRLRSLVAAKLAEAQGRVAELVAFTAELERAATVLSRHTPDGPCDDRCGCTTDPTTVVARSAAPTAGRARAPEPEVACTLEASRLAGRLASWQVALAPVVARELIHDGVRLTFPSGTPLGQLADLVAAEQGCCAFFRFAITVDARGAALEITAPPDAQDLVESLFGAWGQSVGAPRRDSAGSDGATS